MDDQQLLVGIVGGLIGWLIGMAALHAMLGWLYPSPASRRYHRRAQSFLKMQERAMQSFVRIAVGGKDTTDR